MDVVPNVDPAAGSAVPEPAAPNLVVISCSCKGSPHEQDTVTLATEVSMDLGMAAAYVLQSTTDVAAGIADLSRVFMRFGIVAWTLVDDTGNPEPITPKRIAARLTYSNGGYEVADAANGLYASTVMRPLLAAREKSSHSGPQDRLTSRKNGSGRKRPAPFAPSSPTGTVGLRSVEMAP